MAGEINSVATTGASTPIRGPLGRIVGKLDLRSVSNGASAPVVRCQTDMVEGEGNRKVSALALGEAYSVIQVARSNEHSPGPKADALDKTLRILAPTSANRFGNLVQVHLTVLGAIHAGVAARLANAPGDTELQGSLHKLEKAIVDIAIKAGKCTGIADGHYHAPDEKTWKLSSALTKAQACITACADQMGKEDMVSSVAEALVPGPLMESINRRLPGLAHEFNQAGSASKLHNVLQTALTGDLGAALTAQLENGGGRCLDACGHRSFQNSRSRGSTADGQRWA